MGATFKKIIFYSLFFLNLLVIFTFWRHGSASMLFLNIGSAFIALGRLFGLLAVYAILLQVLFIGRVRWLESVFGLDKLSVIHHWIGYAALGCMIVHPIFLSIGYGLVSHIGIITQLFDFIIGSKLILLSAIALLLFIIIVLSSIIIVRSKLRYETWYYAHVIVYAAILLAYFHQLALGGDFAAQPSFKIYWIILYLFVLVNLLLYRFAKPLYRYARHRFVVEKVVKETDSAVSVYITGDSMEDFNVKPGQFIIVRFLSKNFLWQAHPFSISGNTDEHIRLTIKGLGDYTRDIPKLKKGTPVIIDGPHGIFTIEKAHKKKFLFIAGGVGITPIKAMLEECRRDERDVILLYANRKKEDIIFYDEISHLAGISKAIKVHHVLADPDSTWKGEKGFIDEEKLNRLIADIKHREVYICGPPPMMKAMVSLLRNLGVRDRNIHYERFSL